MAKTGPDLANQMLKDKIFKEASARLDAQKPNNPGIVYPHNKEDFLKRHGLDKYYEFDGGDLVDLEDMSTTPIGVWDNGAQEDYLLDQIEKLGKWKRPDPAVQKLKAAGWSDERIAAAEQGNKEKHPDLKEAQKQTDKWTWNFRDDVKTWLKDSPYDLSDEDIEYIAKRAKVRR